MKKYFVFAIFFVTVLFIGAGCNTNELGDTKYTSDTDQSITKTFDQQIKVESSNEYQAKEQIGRVSPAVNNNPEQQKAKINIIKLSESVPKLNKEYEYYRSHGSVRGQLKARFINEETEKVVPGHSVDCVSCIDTYFKKGQNGQLISVYPESNIDGEMIINATDNQASISRARDDWYSYNTRQPLKPGDQVEIYLKPQPVKDGQRLIFPKVEYQKNNSGNIQLMLIIRDAKGEIITGYNASITGPTYDNKRTSAFGLLNNRGEANIILPINGAYRMQLIKQVEPGTRGVSANDFYQFDAPTGYNILMEIVL